MAFLELLNVIKLVLANSYRQTNALSFQWEVKNLSLKPILRYMQLSWYYQGLVTRDLWLLKDIENVTTTV